MKSLNLTFKSNLGKTHVMKLNYAKTELDEATVKAAMNNLANMHIFNKDGEDIYAQPVSAKYSETVSTPIFTVKKDTTPAA